jgi:hypothetical protein
MNTTSSLSAFRLANERRRLGCGSRANRGNDAASDRGCEAPMTFKTNYRQQRAERARIQSQRKDEKLQKRQEELAKRKGERKEPAAADADRNTPT